ncbi:putative dna excision repair protein [Phaeomoniella chlamydospora]|uniref:Putative dna excision repair protein n=1 Tax=Phaeomoniella chlamydospora TaxID=158046 RepID=A0A0G2G2E3_PHACM|nr:putative dna excision repair protein [Phaeomoniella chlamydospora]
MSSDQEVYEVDSGSTLSSDDSTLPARVSRPARQHADTGKNKYEDDPHVKPKAKEKYARPERLQFSSGSENDGEVAYKQFKARKSEARKRAVRSTKKAKAIAKDRSQRGRKNADHEAMVGRRKPTKQKNKKHERIYGDDSEDDLMEWTVPEYLKKRRSHFETRAEKLKNAGLRLPPSFDNIHFSDDDNLEDLLEKPDLPALKPCAPYKDIQLPYSLGLLPAPIAQWLRDYQVEGVAFLHELFVYQKGGILGDEMGTGKTIQVIAFLTAAYGKTGDERDDKRMRKIRRKDDSGWYPRTLIICPGSLIANWQSELSKWGWWHVEKFHGSAAEKQAALEAASAGRIEIMITTYTTYRINKSRINVIPWDCVVADECHIIKERRSEITQSLNEINALCRIGLTGTAIQNKYEELWTLLNWTNPGRLGPITVWKASISEPLKIGQSHNATVYQLSKARKVARQLVDNLLPQFFLRRMKSLIANELPKKSDRVVCCPMTSAQIDAYENFLNSDIVQAIKRSSEPCDCGQPGKKRGWCCYQTVEGQHGGLTKWQNYVFPAISNLQRLSNHLALIIPQGTDQLEKQDKDLDMLQVCFPDSWKQLYRERDNIIHFSNPTFCGKWRVLKRLLKFWHAAGDKVLVFSHSVRLLKMLQMLFTHTSYNVSYLDGSMSLEDRAKVVDEFNSDENQFVFLISTKAGGVGLNITSANKVVVVDPNWNPAWDLQAQDRAYRIGQTRDVEVFRLIAAGGIEEVVYARQIYKQQQANIGYNASSERRYFQGVQERSDMKGEIFGLSNLFELRKEGELLLKDIVNKTNVAESRAGVLVAEASLEDGENGDESGSDDDEDKVAIKSEARENAAISQIAALITSRPDCSPDAQRADPSSKKSMTRDSHDLQPPKQKKHDPVQAILLAAGVQYTHENSEVIGTSKVESRISKQAQEASPSSDVRAGDRRIFIEESQNTPHGQKQGKVDPADEPITITFKHHPPEQVKQRQFCEMARWAGYGSAVEFGLAVESWTQEERRNCLERFYEYRGGVIRQLMVEEDVKGQDVKYELKSSPPLPPSSPLLSHDSRELSTGREMIYESVSETDTATSDDDAL